MNYVRLYEAFAVKVVLIFIPQFGCKAKPHMSCHIVLGDAFASGVHNAEAELGEGNPLLGTFPIPLQSFGVVLDGACQRRRKSTPLAGVKMHHLMRFSPPGQPWAGLSGFWGFPPFLALVETVAVAVHLQDMNVVCEPVQQRPSQALGTEHLGPLIER